MDVALYLNNIESVNDDSGVLSLSVLIDLLWTDELICWDHTKTPGAYGATMPSSWLWNPQVTLVNAASPYSDGMSDNDLYLYSTGDVYSTNTGSIYPICVFDFTNFPFDTQYCDIVFGSAYYNYKGGVNLTLSEINDDLFNKHISNVKATSGAVSWNFIDIYPSSSGGSQVQWTLVMARYTTYYWASAIIPNLAVTSVALLALFINDITSRLGVAFTAMLTIIAVMVS